MHASPFFCPYCGEQEIRPTEEDNEWYCKTCNRRWTLVFVQLGKPKED